MSQLKKYHKEKIHLYEHRFVIRLAKPLLTVVTTCASWCRRENLGEASSRVADTEVLKDELT